VVLAVPGETRADLVVVVGFGEAQPRDEPPHEDEALFQRVEGVDRSPVHEAEIGGGRCDLDRRERRHHAVEETADPVLQPAS
jgi:hypothetical protein